MSIKNIVNDYIKEYDFGYDINYIRHDKDFKETEDENGHIIVHVLVFLEFIEDANSENHLGDMYIKINKTTKNILESHFKLRKEKEI